MDNYCRSLFKYYPQSSAEDYSDDIQADRHEYTPPQADDAHYFDIDISSPVSPLTDTSPIRNSGSSSDEDHSEDEIEFNFSICSSNSPNPNHCFSPADTLFYQGQLLPLQLIQTPPQYDVDIKGIHPSLHSSSNIPLGVKSHFPNLLKTATKLKIFLFRFRKPSKIGMDLQSSCAECGTDVGMDFPVPKQNRLLTLKLKVVEVPLVSLFTRDNSKGAKRDGSNWVLKKTEDSDDGERHCKNMDRDKKKAKEIVQKYVKKIKPLYVKISRKCNEKIRFGDLEKPRGRNGVKNGIYLGSESSEHQMSFSYGSPSHFPGNLKMLYKHLGKGKRQPSEMQQKLPKYCSSESTLMEVQSAIQGAIRHCKQSIDIDDTPNCPNFGCSMES
eukprot:PITA_28816